MYDRFVDRCARFITTKDVSACPVGHSSRSSSGVLELLFLVACHCGLTTSSQVARALLLHAAQRRQHPPTVLQYIWARVHVDVKTSMRASSVAGRQAHLCGPPRGCMGCSASVETQRLDRTGPLRLGHLETVGTHNFRRILKMAPPFAVARCPGTRPVFVLAWWLRSCPTSLRRCSGCGPGVSRFWFLS